MLDDVGEALLGDAVDDELLFVGERRQLALRRHEARADARALAEGGDLRGERGHEPVVVERRRAELAGEVQQLLHRLRRERLRVGELGEQVGRRVADRRREPQQDRGQRLVDLVVEVLGDPRALLLLGAQHRAAGLAALGSSRPSMRLKSAVRRWTSVEARGVTSARVPGDARSTVLIVPTSCPIGSSRRRAAASSAAPPRARRGRSAAGPASPTASLSRSRATTAATKAVMATRTVLTASTWVSSVRWRIRPRHRHTLLVS